MILKQEPFKQLPEFMQPYSFQWDPMEEARTCPPAHMDSTKYEDQNLYCSNP